MLTYMDDSSVLLANIDRIKVRLGSVLLPFRKATGHAS